MADGADLEALRHEITSFATGAPLQRTAESSAVVDARPLILCAPCDSDFVERELRPHVQTSWQEDVSIYSGAPDGEAQATRAVSDSAHCYVVVSDAGLAEVRVQLDGARPARYTVLGMCTVRSGSEPGSRVIGQLEVGREICATGSTVDSTGITKLKCEDGWVAYRPHVLRRVGARVKSAPQQSQRATKLAHPVATDGTEVPGVSEEVDMQLGEAEQRVFTVGQTHIPKAPNLVQLKVGDSGLDVFGGSNLLETHPYSSIDTWAVGKHKRFLSVTKNDKGKREIKFQVIGDEGVVIANLIEDRATSVAQKLVDDQTNENQVPVDSEIPSADDASTDDDEDAEAEKLEWWKEEMRLPQDRLNLIESPALHRFFSTKADRTVHFSGSVVEVRNKSQQHEYTMIVSKRAVYRMVGSVPNASSEWDCKGRLRLARLKSVTCSKLLDQQIVLTFSTSGGRTRSRMFEVEEGRRDQLVRVLQKLYSQISDMELEVMHADHALFAGPSPKSTTGSVFTKDTYTDRKVMEGDDAAELTYTVLMGCAMSVASGDINTEPLSARAFYPEDYTCEERRSFPAAGSQETAPHKHRDFEFIAYAPRVFQRIREIGGVSEASYLQSLTGLSEEEVMNMNASNLGTTGLPSGATLCRMSSNSKSGAFFFFTTDMCFIVKTVGHDEKKVLVEMLGDYLAHYERSPESLINKICGCYQTDVSKEPFIVMKCTFPLKRGIPIHEVYDLKGSMHGRQIKEKEKQDKVVIYKDNDFDENPHRAFKLDTEKRAWFLKRLKADVAFLQSHSLIDYSLLIGIHFKDKTSNLDFDGTNPIYSKEGESEVYYIEIIDYLIRYNSRKKLEKTLRGGIVNRSNKKNRDLEFSSLSVCEPSEYSERMVHFITSKTPHPGMMTHRRRSSTVFSNRLMGGPIAAQTLQDRNVGSPGRSPRARGGGGSGGSGGGSAGFGGMLLPGLDEAAMKALQAAGLGNAEDDDPSATDIAEMDSEENSLGAIAEDTDESDADEPVTLSSDSKPDAAISPLLGKYRVLKTSAMREGSSMDTTIVGSLEKGAVIEVTNAVELDSGITRIRCSEGWLSLRPHLVEKVDSTVTLKRSPSKSSRRSARRHSVAVEGIKLVGSLGEEMARSMGVVADKVFEVTQKKGSKVDMKVGGMGIALFNKGKLVESFLYQNLKSWSSESKGNVLCITKRDGQVIRYGTHHEAVEICKLMESRATSVHKAASTPTRVQNEAEMLGTYRVMQQAVVRSGPETTSAQSGELQADEFIEVTEAVLNSAGVVRLRCSLGWLSLKQHLVSKVAVDARSDLSSRGAAAPATLSTRANRARRHSVAAGDNSSMKTADRIARAAAQAVPSMDAITDSETDLDESSDSDDEDLSRAQMSLDPDSSTPSVSNALVRLFSHTVDRIDRDSSSVTLVWLAEHVTVEGHGQLLKRFDSSAAQRDLSPYAAFEIAGRGVGEIMARLLSANGIHVDPRDKDSINASACHRPDGRASARVQHQRVKMEATLAQISPAEGEPPLSRSSDPHVTTTDLESAIADDSVKANESLAGVLSDDSFDEAEFDKLAAELIGTDTTLEENSSPKSAAAITDISEAKAQAWGATAEAAAVEVAAEAAAALAEVAAAVVVEAKAEAAAEIQVENLTETGGPSGNTVQRLQAELAEREMRHHEALERASASAAATQSRLESDLHLYATELQSQKEAAKKSTAQIDAARRSAEQRLQEVERLYAVAREQTPAQNAAVAWHEEREAMIASMRQLQEEQQDARAASAEHLQHLREGEAKHKIAEAAWASQQIRLQAELNDRLEAVMSMAAAASVDTGAIDETTRLQRRVRELERKIAQQRPAPHSGGGELTPVTRSDTPAVPNSSLQIECERLEAENRGLAAEVAMYHSRLDHQRSEHANLVAENHEMQSALRRQTNEQKRTMDELHELRAQHAELCNVTMALSPTRTTIAYSEKFVVGSGNSGDEAFDNVRNRAVAVQQQVEELEQEMRELIIAAPLVPGVSDNNAPAAVDDMYQSQVEFREPTDMKKDRLAPTPVLASEFDLREFCQANQLHKFEAGLRSLGGVTMASLRNVSLAELNQLGLDTMEKLRFRRSTRALVQ